MHILTPSLVLTAVLSFAGVASAADVGCRPHGAVTWITHFRDLPPPIAQNLFDRLHEMADVGGPFNETDVIDVNHPLPQHRLVVAARAGRTTVVWYEYGGFVSGTNAAVYDETRFVEDVQAYRGCAALDRAKR
ncbi:MAG TPA: hypothetical protein VG407_01315 [Caulobacteraceae bacterium]|jgi:hypothetical protein|nr:hypothetical protein [Caulobacteraceae bacterium]